MKPKPGDLLKFKSIPPYAGKRMVFNDPKGLIYYMIRKDIFLKKYSTDEQWAHAISPNFNSLVLGSWSGSEFIESIVGKEVFLSLLENLDICREPLQKQQVVQILHSGGVIFTICFEKEFTHNLEIVRKENGA